MKIIQTIIILLEYTKLIVLKICFIHIHHEIKMNFIWPQIDESLTQ